MPYFPKKVSLKIEAPRGPLIPLKSDFFGLSRGNKEALGGLLS
jgi:hypothetical protein